MVNDIIEVEIVKLNINFEGIGFLNNKKVCVKNTLVGEVVKAKVVFEIVDQLSAALIGVDGVMVQQHSAPLPTF